MSQEKASRGLPTFEIFLSGLVYLSAVIFAIFKVIQFCDGECGSFGFSWFLVEYGKFSKIHENFQSIFFLNVFATGLQTGSYFFNDGWWFLNRRRDTDDEEWHRFLKYIRLDVYWLLGHIVISELIRYISPKVSRRIKPS